MEAHGIVFHWKENVEKCQAPRIGEIGLKLSSGTEIVVDHVLVCAAAPAPPPSCIWTGLASGCPIAG